MRRFDMRSTSFAIWHLVSDRPAESRTVHAIRLVAALLSLRVSTDSMRARKPPVPRGTGR